jgi:Bacterial Ig-like domain (group 3)
MNRTFTTLVAVAVATVASGGLVVGGVGGAAASTIPPWEPDAAAAGTLTFYDAAGNKITTGSTTASPFAAYVAGSSALRSGDTKATLFGYKPVKGTAAGKWTGVIISGATAYPSGSSHAPKTALPVVTGAKGDLTIAELAAELPTTKVAGYRNVYQIRLETSAPGTSVTTSYNVADIEVVGTSWKEIYPSHGALKKTATTLKASKSSISKGQKLTLSAKESPATPGKVEFLDGSKKLAVVAVRSGKASYLAKSLAAGKHKVEATFIPSDRSSYAASTSKVVTVTVKK